jgi:hypothetical protein
MVGMDDDVPTIFAHLKMDEEPVVAARDFSARVAESQRHGNRIAGPHLARGQFYACQLRLEVGVNTLARDWQANA